MSNASKCVQRALRAVRRDAGGGGWAGSPASHRLDVVGVQLLAPEHAGEGLPHDHRLVGGSLGRGQRGVELVGLAMAPLDHRVDVDVRRTRPAAAGGGPRPSRPAATSSRYHSETFVPVWSGLTVGAPLTTWSLMPSFGWAAPEVEPNTRRSFVSLSQNSAHGIGAVGAREGDQLHRSDDRMIDRHDAVVAPLECRLDRIDLPTPGVAEPGGRQHVERRGVRAGVGRPHDHHDVVDVGLHVVDLDHPVAVVVERAGVEQFVLGVVLAAPAVLLDEVAGTGTRSADSGTATGSTRGSARSRGTTSSPWRPRRGCPGRR